MTECESTPFAGLFNLTAPGKGRDLNWEFFEPDLNGSARRLLTQIDTLFAVAAEQDCVFLTTIENDAEAGQFPEVVVNFFAGEYLVDLCALLRGANDPSDRGARCCRRPNRLLRRGLSDWLRCWPMMMVSGGALAYR